MVTYDAFGRKIYGAAVSHLVNSFVQPTLGTVIPDVATPIPANPAVQERMRELREKEAAAKADAELRKTRADFMEAQRIEGVRHTVEKESIQWEAELLIAAEKCQPWIRLLVEKGAMMEPPGIKDSFQCHFTKVLCGITEDSIPKKYTVENERKRHRIRVMKHIIQTVRATLAEEARIAAEEKVAVARAREARQKIAIDISVEEYRKIIVKTIKTPWHSFTGVDSTGRAVYVLYDEKTKILRFEAKQFAFYDPGVKVHGEEYSPAASKAPTSWNGLYEKGQLPFLTCCPVCSDQITLRCRRLDDWGHHAPDIWSVGCIENHYRWDPATNQHWRLGWPGQWNPRDPDGSIAARAARDKKIAELEAQLETLKRT
jgi:hypothetical protein